MKVLVFPAPFTPSRPKHCRESETERERKRERDIQILTFEYFEHTVYMNPLIGMSSIRPLIVPRSLGEYRSVSRLV